MMMMMTPYWMAKASYSIFMDFRSLNVGASLSADAVDGYIHAAPGVGRAAGITSSGAV